jgi:hypothetical protein
VVKFGGADFLTADIADGTDVAREERFGFPRKTQRVSREGREGNEGLVFGILPGLRET